MQPLYVFVFFLGVLFFILRKRRVDFYTFSFASSGIYFFPGLLGFVHSVSLSGQANPIPITTNTYLIFISVLFALTIGSILHDNVSKERSKVWLIRNDKYAEKILFLFAFLSAIAFIVVEWNELTSSGKPSFGRMHAIYQIITGLGLAYALGLKHVKLVVLLGLLMLIDVYGGNREGLLLAILTGIMFYLGNLGKIRLVKYWKIIAASLITALLFIGYKGVYVAIQAKNWDLVKYRLINSVYWIDAVRTMEPFTTQNVLNQTIIEGITFPLIEWVRPVFHDLIIFSPSLGASSTRFSDHFMDSLYPFLHWGMASNIWAEGYAVGGMLLVLIIIVIYALILPWLFNVLYGKTQGFLRIIITYSGCYFLFFIHRTGLNYMVTLQKRIFILLLLVTMITWFFFEAIGRRKKLKDVRR